MHLAGEAGESLRRVTAERGDGRLDAVDPVLGRLFAPERMRARDFQRGGGFGDRALTRIDEQGFDRGGSDVEAEIGRAFVRGARHGVLREWRFASALSAPSLAKRRGIVAGTATKNPGVAAGVSHTGCGNRSDKIRQR